MEPSLFPVWSGIGVEAVQNFLSRPDSAFSPLDRVAQFYRVPVLLFAVNVGARRREDANIYWSTPIVPVLRVCLPVFRCGYFFSWVRRGGLLLLPYHSGLVVPYGVIPNSILSTRVHPVGGTVGTLNGSIVPQLLSRVDSEKRGAVYLCCPWSRCVGLFFGAQIVGRDPWSSSLSPWFQVPKYFAPGHFLPWRLAHLHKNVVLCWSRMPPGLYRVDKRPLLFFLCWCPFPLIFHRFLVCNRVHSTQVRAGLGNCWRGSRGRHGYPSYITVPLSVRTDTNLVSCFSDARYVRPCRRRGNSISAPVSKVPF